MISRMCALLLCLPTLAGADCVTPDDLATGIAFKRQDGRTGLAKSDGTGVTIDYATSQTSDWTDLRKTDRGIYEKTWAYMPSDAMFVGPGPGGGYAYSLQGKPPDPTAGTIWKTRVKVSASNDDGTESGGKTARYSLQATYSYQAVKEAKLSGCTYRVQPVEATFTSPGHHETRRWIYFPDLGFGLETRFTDHTTGEDRKLGLTALTQQG